jgi:predicted RNase H-like nuclease (RuvC/YqgF family)
LEAAQKQNSQEIQKSRDLEKRLAATAYALEAAQKQNSQEIQNSRDLEKRLAATAYEMEAAQKQNSQDIQEFCKERMKVTENLASYYEGMEHDISSLKERLERLKATEEQRGGFGERLTFLESFAFRLASNKCRL